MMTLDDIGEYTIYSENEDNAQKVTETQKNEGFRNSVYMDTEGNPTIGYGHKLTQEDISSGRFSNGISKEDAQALYEKDYTSHKDNFYKNNEWALNQPPQVREVLEDMAYNMGSGFMKEWPNLEKQLKNGDYEAASQNILSSKYATQVKGRADRNASKLVNSKYEQDQYDTADTTNYNNVMTLDDIGEYTVEESKFDGRVSESGIPLMAGENQPDKESSLSDKILGGLEATATMATGATTGFLGHIYGTAKGIIDQIESGKIGSEKGARLIEEEAAKYAQKGTYMPEYEEGQKYVKEIVKAIEPLNAIAPLAGEISAIQRAIPKKAKIPKTPISETEDALSAAAKNNIKVMTSDIKEPRTFFGKTAQQTGERIPVVGTGELRKAQQQTRIDAVKNLTSNYVDDLGENFTSEIMSSLSEKRANTVNKFSSMKNEISTKLAGRKVDMAKTMKEIDNQVKILESINTKSSKAGAEALKDYKTAFMNKDLNGIELVRKELGNLFESQDLTTVKNQGQKAVNKIYAAVKEDTNNFIVRNGDAKDSKIWKVANEQLSKTSKELESSALKSVLKKGTIEPENVEKMLFSKKPSQIKLLYKNLDREGRKNAKAAIIARALQKADKDTGFSPATFSSELGRLKEPLAVFLTHEDKLLFDGLTKALAVTKRADQFALNPPTGVQLSIPVGTAILTDMMGGAGAGLATGGIAGIAARLYETIPIKKALMKLGQAQNGTKQYDNAVVYLMMAIMQESRDKEKDKQREYEYKEPKRN